MKVKMNDQSLFTTFESIRKGEIFIWEEGVLIKTEETSRYGVMYNAVDLEDGEYYSIDGLEQVIRPTSYEFSVNY